MNVTGDKLPFVTHTVNSNYHISLIRRGQLTFQSCKVFQGIKLPVPVFAKKLLKIYFLLFKIPEPVRCIFLKCRYISQNSMSRGQCFWGSSRYSYDFYSYDLYSYDQIIYVSIFLQKIC
jgi:hypothetical protein